ncbi:hypothetical protein LINPERPRIM_LOCUS2294 [Linum perenne]
MNPDVVDIGSSSFIPSEFIPVVHEEVPKGFLIAISVMCSFYIFPEHG